MALLLSACGAGLNAVGRTRSVEMNILLRNVVVELAQWIEVVENQERAAVRGDYEIVVLNDEVVYGRGRQIQFERTPVPSIIEGNIDAVFGSRIEQSALLWIFADGAHETAFGNSVG